LISDCFSNAGISPRNNLINEVISQIKRENNCLASEFDYNPNFINFTNGLLNIETWELEEHGNYLSRIQIPVDYSPDAKCPEFDSFLSFIVENSPNPEQMKKTILEMIGYCLTTSIERGKAFILYSEKPNTAKSTLINILVYLIGENNCSKTALDKIAHNRFGKEALAHKILNYFTDLPTTAIKENGIIKDLITDKEFVWEGKGLPEQKHRNIIKLVFSCNTLPRVKNMTDAFAKRWVLIPFHNQIPENKKEENWEGKHILNNKNELEGIVAQCVEALKKLKERKKFINSSEEEIIDEWENGNNVIYRFIKCCCEKLDEYRVSQKDLIASFKKYKKTHKEVYGKKLTGLTQDMNRLGYEKTDTRREQPLRYEYSGLKLKEKVKDEK